MAEDEMVGWYHQLNGHEFEQTQGDVKDREAQHAVVHGLKELDPTEQLYNNKGENYMIQLFFIKNL